MEPILDPKVLVCACCEGRNAKDAITEHLKWSTELCEWLRPTWVAQSFEYIPPDPDYLKVTSFAGVPRSRRAAFAIKWKADRLGFTVEQFVAEVARVVTKDGITAAQRTLGVDIRLLRCGAWNVHEDTSKKFATYRRWGRIQVRRVSKNNPHGWHKLIVTPAPFRHWTRATMYEC